MGEKREERGGREEGGRGEGEEQMKEEVAMKRRGRIQVHLNSDALMIKSLLVCIFITVLSLVCTRFESRIDAPAPNTCHPFISQAGFRVGQLQLIRGLEFTCKKGGGEVRYGKNRERHQEKIRTMLGSTLSYT